MTPPIRTLALLGVLTSATAWAEEPVDFEKQVLPIFKEKCFSCHSLEKGKEKGGVALDFPDEVKRYIGDQEIIVPGSPQESDLLRLVLLDEDHKDSMPPPGKGDALTQREVELVRDWIEQGASLEKGGSPEARKLAEQGPPRVYEKWTNEAGKEIEAEFRGVEKGQVALLLKDGKMVKVNFATLSKESQALARKRHAEAGVKQE